MEIITPATSAMSSLELITMNLLQYITETAATTQSVFLLRGIVVAFFFLLATPLLSSGPSPLTLPQPRRGPRLGLLRIFRYSAYGVLSRLPLPTQAWIGDRHTLGRPTISSIKSSSITFSFKNDCVAQWIVSTKVRRRPWVRIRSKKGFVGPVFVPVFTDGRKCYCNCAQQVVILPRVVGLRRPPEKEAWRYLEINHFSKILSSVEKALSESGIPKVKNFQIMKDFGI